ncbi:MAG: hypothetical protein ACYDC0_08730 [Acidimicrobiales bacterium]
MTVRYDVGSPAGVGLRAQVQEQVQLDSARQTGDLAEQDLQNVRGWLGRQRLTRVPRPAPARSAPTRP